MPRREALAPPAFYAVLPFAGLLLAVAILPLVPATVHWWECNWNRLLVAGVLGALTLAYYALLYGHGVIDHATHQLSAPGWPAAATVLKNAVVLDFIPFITLLFSLYVISGGIRVDGHLIGRPATNAKFIAVGAVLASFIGTTGAAMLLIRPLLRANAPRKYVAHTVVFFIIVVCNTGGCLLPLGDPPLYLGYLRGVDFAWTLSLWPQWTFMNAALLAVYYVWDRECYRREDRESVERLPEHGEDYAVRGAVNVLWLAGVMGCLLWLDPSTRFPGTDWHPPPYTREALLLGFAGLSLLTTKGALRRKNEFNYDAILEVAALFIGIFICMQAPVQVLNACGPRLGVDSAAEFYWSSGVLSSFLDNAPTYVVFFETARTIAGEGPRMAGVLLPHLAAISLGAVFMGSITYIGNGPNFMVKTIAESQGVRMPGFFGYMAYSCAVILPLSWLMTWIFF